MNDKPKTGLTPAQYLGSVLREIATRAAMGVAYEKSWPADFARKEIREVWLDEQATMRDARKRRVTVDEIRAIPDTERRALGFAHWDETLILVPLWAYHYIADGETLVAIDDAEVVKGKDDIDLDVRFGCIAFGFRP